MGGFELVLGKIRWWVVWWVGIIGVVFNGWNVCYVNLYVDDYCVGFFVGWCGEGYDWVWVVDDCDGVVDVCDVVVGCGEFVVCVVVYY